ncbi:hypothetical protein WJX84_009040 [Apatococcus fuscideae]|uniref:cellulase n=1 Tax=Apatococcus fuscideae TaxID=2026836 RepID=A0AAW1SXV3_9CHLO
MWNIWGIALLAVHICVVSGSGRSLFSNTTIGANTTSHLPAVYPWDKLLDQSFYFYEAQRSGKLPEAHKILWRGDSALKDLGPKGEDLSGGHYNNGGFLKNVFPYASTTSTIAWGVLEFKQAYKDAEVYDEALDHLKWAAKFLLACHIEQDLYVAAIGMNRFDYPQWSRPEDMHERRPVYIVDSGMSSSDLLGSASAGLTAVSLVFKEENSTFAYECLVKAQALYA